ncbi:MAG: hypothetical protein C0600_14215 [Ignavibacteria bacterium]|nr:MAG: hypothetical protein C0600_14215 [Ignavibacteria bacterium]
MQPSTYSCRIWTHLRGATVVAVLLLLASSAHAQVTFMQQRNSLISEESAGLLAPSEYRSVIDLNGMWQYRTEDDESWKQVNVPSSYKGRHAVVFRRDFSVPRAMASRSVFQIVALSISYYCEITINGQFIGKHAGLTSFNFKISPGIIKPGTNSIEISVHNFLDTHETIPLYEQMWDRLNYGGIVHDIGLAAHQGVWVQESFVTTQVTGAGRSARLHYRALLNSGEVSSLPSDTIGGTQSFGKSSVQHLIEIVEPISGLVLAGSEPQRVTVESDRLKEVEISISLPSVNLWSPEAPNLYELRQRTLRGGVVLDETRQPIGFRSIQVRDGNLVLNGSPLYIKAMTYLEDSPRHGRSLSFDEMERDVLMMKNLGANTVRLAAGSPHPAFMALCDRYGLLVFHDLPLQDVPSSLLSKAGIHTSAKNIAREVIARDFNRPSLIALGLAQGVQHLTPAVLDYVDNVSQVTRESERLLKYMTFQSMLPSELPEGLHFAGLDIMPQSTESVSAMISGLADKLEGHPVIVSSLMYPVQIGNYNGYSDPRSIDAQGQFYLQLYKEIRDLGYDGVTVHSFSDWAVSRPIMAVDRVYEYVATTGVVDRFRQKRIAYDVLKSSFNNEKPPVLVTGNYEEQHPVSFVIFGILIIFIFAIVYNLFRRFRENVVRSLLRPYNFYADVRDQRMLSIFQTSMVGLLGSFSAALLYANVLYFWRINILMDKVLSQFVHTIWLKQWLNFAAWNPLEHTLVLTVLFFVLLLFFALSLRVLSLIVRRKVFMFDAYSVSMWSALPMIILAPFGMVLYRIMDPVLLEILIILVLVIFHIWIVSRMLKGSAIVFDIRPLFAYLAGFVLIGAGLAYCFISLNNEFEIVAYMRYYIDLWWSFANVAV